MKELKHNQKQIPIRTINLSTKVHTYFKILKFYIFVIFLNDPNSIENPSKKILRKKQSHRHLLLLEVTDLYKA